MFVKRVLRWIVTAALRIVGLVAILAVWDYTQQAKAAQYDYGFKDYPPSVVARYGDQIGYAVAVYQIGVNGAHAGIRKISESGVLKSLGQDAGVEAVRPDTPAKPVEGLVQVAAFRTGSAPETSLFPRARVLP